MPAFPANGDVLVIKADGSEVFAKWMVKQVVGPASYAAGGFAVDCSDKFSSILEVAYTRAFNTSGGAILRFHGGIAEVAANTFANAKFQFQAYKRVAGHAHTYDKTNTPTDSTLDTAPAGVGAGHTHGLTFTSTTSGSTSSSSAEEEVTDGSDFSARTFSFLVLGVPK